MNDYQIFSDVKKQTQFDLFKFYLKIIYTK